MHELSHEVLGSTLLACEAIFNWVSKLIWNCFGFSLFRYVIGPENTCHFLNQLDLKLTSIATKLPAFSCAFGSLVVFTESLHWLSKVFSFLLIGSGFGFTELT